MILTAVSANNQPVPKPKVGSNNQKFYLSYVGLGLVIGQLCAKGLLFIAPMVVRVRDFGGDSTLRYHKIFVNGLNLTGLQKYVWVQILYLE